MGAATAHYSVSRGDTLANRSNIFAAELISAWAGPATGTLVETSMLAV